MVRVDKSVPSLAPLVAMDNCSCRNCRQRDRVVAKIAALPAAAISEGQLNRLRDPRRQGHTGDPR